jgi:hypothetical protein
MTLTNLISSGGSGWLSALDTPGGCSSEIIVHMGR